MPRQQRVALEQKPALRHDELLERLPVELDDVAEFHPNAGRRLDDLAQLDPTVVATIRNSRIAAAAIEVEDRTHRIGEARRVDRTGEHRRTRRRDALAQAAHEAQRLAVVARGLRLA